MRSNTEDQRPGLWRPVLLAVLAIIALIGVVIGPTIWSVAVMISEIESEDDLRQRLSEAGLIAPLQQWAMEVLESEDSLSIAGDDLPPLLKNAGVRWVALLRDQDDEAYIHLEFGGGFHHYGLLIGPPGFRPTASETERINQWRDGLWFRVAG